MWAVLAVLSAIFLGLYDAAKKQALRKNGVLAVLLVATALSTLFVSPWLRFGPAGDHLRLALKAVLVTASWVSGMVALKLLPLTTVSTFKGSRPVFVVLFSVILYGETLSWQQWVGVAVVLISLFLLGHTSREDAPVQVRKAGFIWMAVSILTGVASALYDKHIMQGMAPLFVQSWTNLYITVLLALCVLGWRGLSRPERGRPWPREWEGPAAEAVGGMSKAKSGRDNPRQPEEYRRFQWDWWIVVVAVLITAADALYFFSLKQPGALLSVISVIRRASVIITFLCGAVFFKEGNLKAKSFNLLLMAAGVVMLLIF